MPENVPRRAPTHPLTTPAAAYTSLNITIHIWCSYLSSGRQLRVPASSDPGLVVGDRSVSFEPVPILSMEESMQASCARSGPLQVLKTIRKIEAQLLHLQHNAARMSCWLAKVVQKLRVVAPQSLAVSALYCSRKWRTLTFCADLLAVSVATQLQLTASTSRPALCPRVPHPWPAFLRLDHLY